MIEKIQCSDIALILGFDKILEVKIVLCGQNPRVIRCDFVHIGLVVYGSLLQAAKKMLHKSPKNDAIKLYYVMETKRLASYIIPH